MPWFWQSLGEGLHLGNPEPRQGPAISPEAWQAVAAPSGPMANRKLVGASDEFNVALKLGYLEL